MIDGDGRVFVGVNSKGRQHLCEPVLERLCEEFVCLVYDLKIANFQFSNPLQLEEILGLEKKKKKQWGKSPQRTKNLKCCKEKLGVPTI